jgi:hypothetical protein
MDRQVMGGTEATSGPYIEDAGLPGGPRDEPARSIEGSISPSAHAPVRAYPGAICG